MNCIANVNGIQELQTHTCICLAAQSCPALCNSMDCSPPGSSIHEILPGRNTGVGCHALLQGILPTQRSDPGLSLAGGFFIVWATRKPIYIIKSKSNIFMYFNNFLLPLPNMYKQFCFSLCMYICVHVYIYTYIYIYIYSQQENIIIAVVN